MLESREELMAQLQRIEKWEKSQSGLWFWERIGRLPFKLLDKITPKFIHNKVGSLLNEIGSYIQTGGRYLISEKAILTEVERAVGTPVSSVEDIKHIPLNVMATVSDKIVSQRKNLATIQGATTGVGGVFTLAADIPAILTISLKTLQEIAIIHGYDPKEKNERAFVVKCLQFSSADIVGKRAILKSLSGQEGSSEVMSELQGWREVVYTYRDQYGWKKLLQIVPVAGLIFGAFTNRSMINDLAEVGTMLYQKRRIMDRLREES